VVFNKPKGAHISPPLKKFHRLPIAVCIKFKALMFAYRQNTGSAPLYLNLLLQIYVPSRNLKKSQRGLYTLRTFTLTVQAGGMTCSYLPQSLAIFKKLLKRHIFRQHLTH